MHCSDLVIAVSSGLHLTILEELGGREVEGRNESSTLYLQAFTLWLGQHPCPFCWNFILSKIFSLDHWTQGRSFYKNTKNSKSKVSENSEKRIQIKATFYRSLNVHFTIGIYMYIVLSLHLTKIIYRTTLILTGIFEEHKHNTKK